MLRKKQVLALVGIVCIIAASLSLVYAATWTPDQLADWMFNVGRHKIWTTNYIVKNQLKPTLDGINEKVDYEVAHETLDVQIQTVDVETIVDAGWNPNYPMHSTQIGGIDIYSDAYVIVSFRGQRVDATITRTVSDGGKNIWLGGIENIQTETGVYDSFVEATSGTPAGSYLVVVEVTKTIGPSTYYGTASYIIECTATIS